MERSRSKRIVIILDCCYAGAVSIGRKGSKDDAAKSGREAIASTVEKNVEDKIREGQQKSVLASSLADQASYKMDDQPYSMFTYFLVEGLKGASGKSVDDNGNVTPYSLGKYVHGKIREHLAKK
ncbi:MAG TPA: caspase family protein, partial [Nitrososphaeraceae archaeon]|nr:caspase family protein [Nitrososphaeraceae archaeon]